MTSEIAPETGYSRAAIIIDPHKAQITRFNADAHHSRYLEAQSHQTRQHNSDVRDVHEFFAAVCDDLTGLNEILVTGGHTGLADFKHYVTKRRPALVKHIIGYETVDHPTEGQFVAFARDVFGNYERLAH